MGQSEVRAVFESARRGEFLVRPLPEATSRCGLDAAVAVAASATADDALTARDELRHYAIEVLAAAGCSVREIGELLNVPKSTVDRWLGQPAHAVPVSERPGVGSFVRMAWSSIAPWSSSPHQSWPTASSDVASRQH